MLLIATGPCFAQQERYIEKTTKVPDSVASSVSAKPDAARIQSNWGKLKKGMTFKEAESLLGKPTKIVSSEFGHSTTWYYGMRIVVFDNVKHAVRYWMAKE
jgi:outer membrane protein assembly factor BamE (lipoprotein component of BamABCDE complex)